MQLSRAGSAPEVAQMPHEADCQIEGSRDHCSIHGIGTKPTAMMGLHRIDVYAYDVYRGEIEADAHVSHARMLIPSRCEHRTLIVRK